jgi:hypothetical protein
VGMPSAPGCMHTVQSSEHPQCTMQYTINDAHCNVTSLLKTWHVTSLTKGNNSQQAATSSGMLTSFARGEPRNACRTVCLLLQEPWHTARTGSARKPQSLQYRGFSARQAILLPVTLTNRCCGGLLPCRGVLDVPLQHLISGIGTWRCLQKQQQQQQQCTLIPA